MSMTHLDHRAIAATIASNDFYRQLYEVSSLGMLAVDQSGRIVLANPALAAMFGYTRDELLGLPLEALLPESLREAHAAQRAAFGAAPHTCPMGYGMRLGGRRKDGGMFPIEVGLSHVELEGQALAVVLVTDVSVRTQIEERLRASEERYLKIVESSAALNQAVLGSLTAHIAVLDAAGEIIAVNQAWERFARENGDPDLAHTGAGANYLAVCRSAAGPDSGAARAALAGIAAVLEGALDHFTIEYPCHSPGEQRWFILRATPLAGDHGAVVSHENITARKQAEEALAEERALLARRVADRTADLSAANAELAHAARLKDEFLASMSHELRTPLNAVLGLSAALQEQVYGPLTDQQRTSLRNIEESGRHLLELINDILDLAKIGAGKLDLELSSVSVPAICQAGLRLIKQDALKKQIAIDLAIDPAVALLHADSRRLKQILVNLLNNAVKFTHQGGSVGLEVAGDVERQVVYLTVWDTGIGIAPEHMDRLFKPFVQIDSRLAREYNGTGLGLALVYRMVELHGGSVAVTSKPGVGSRFTVSLPWNGAVAAGTPVSI